MSVRFAWLSFLLLSICLMPPAVLLPAAAQAATGAVAGTTATPGVLVLGDSLSAGYGLDADQGWVHLLKQKLQAEGFPHTVINASVSGETTAGGLARLPSLLDRYQPQLVLVELGGNDGLRALSVTQIRANLEQIVDRCAAAGATAVLFEMRIPENYGPAYTEKFTEVFGQVSQQRDVPLVPFLLGRFAEDADAFQADGIHPSATVQDDILETVWPALEPLLLKQP